MAVSSSSSSFSSSSFPAPETRASLQPTPPSPSHSPAAFSSIPSHSVEVRHRIGGWAGGVEEVEEGRGREGRRGKVGGGGRGGERGSDVSAPSACSTCCQPSPHQVRGMQLECMGLFPRFVRCSVQQDRRSHSAATTCQEGGAPLVDAQASDERAGLCLRRSVRAHSSRTCTLQLATPLFRE